MTRARMTLDDLTRDFETLADDKHAPAVFRASERIRIHLGEVMGLLRESRDALEPFARYLDMREAKPLRGLGEVIHGIHTGDPCEAELTVEHCRAARDALRCQCRREVLGARLLAPGCHLAYCADAPRPLSNEESADVTARMPRPDSEAGAFLASTTRAAPPGRSTPALDALWAWASRGDLPEECRAAGAELEALRAPAVLDVRAAEARMRSMAAALDVLNAPLDGGQPVATSPGNSARPRATKRKPLSSNQRFLLGYIQSLHKANGQPVPRALLERAPGINARHVTSTLASLIDRGHIRVPTVGTASYVPT